MNNESVFRRLFKAKTMYLTLLFGVFLILGIINASSLIFAWSGKIGTVLWYVSFFLVALVAARFFLTLAYRALVRKQHMVTFVTVLILLVIIGWNTVDVRNVSGETTQEIQCALLHLQETEDWGYQHTCLFGYPARQFFIPALPSLLFGRSLFTLHIGSYLYFFVAVVLFATGMLHVFGKRPHADLVSASILTLILHVHYFNHFMTFYEQSIYPFLFGLTFFGFLFIFIRTHSYESLIMMGFTLQYMIFSYTPGLALFVFCIALLGYLLIFTKSISLSRKWVLGIVLFVLISSIGATLFSRTDIHLASSDRSYSLLLEDIREAAYLFVNPSHGTHMVSPFLFGPFLFFLAGSVFFFRDWKLCIASVWIGAVIFVAVVAKGYAYYDVDFRLHRATVIFPVIFSMLVYLLNRIDRWNMKMWHLAVLFGFIFVSGYWFHVNYVHSREVNDHYVLASWLQQVREDQTLEMDFLYFDVGPEHQTYESIQDVARYFLPGVGVYSFEKRNCPADFGYLQVGSEEVQNYVLIDAGVRDSNCFVREGYILEPIDVYATMVLYRIAS
jgi:hypothetical protein